MPSSQAFADDGAKPVFPRGKFVHIGSKSCAFAGRTAWALQEYKFDAELVDIPLDGGRPTWLREINPLNTVPVILDAAHERVPGNSAALVEWLIEQHSGRGSPAEARALVDAFDASALGPLYAFLRCQAPPGSPVSHDARARVEGALAPIEASYARGDGPFFLGGELSLADIAVFSVLFRFQTSLREFRDYELISAERTPALALGLAACSSRAAFQASQPTSSEIAHFYTTDEVYNPNRECAALDEWVASMCAGVQPVP